MKRCPQCNRVETDSALKFCRVDGATLVSDSSSIGSEAGTAQLGSVSIATEIETSILPHATDANINHGTAATTVLPPQQPSSTSELSKLKSRKAVIVAGAVIVTMLAALVIGGYFYFSRNRSAAIQSVAVMPFVNEVLARSLVKSDQRDEAIRLLAELQSDAQHRYVTSAGFALVFAALGEKDKAFVWLEREFAERASRPPLFSVNPVFDDFRDDPRFQNLLRRIASAKLD